MLFFIHVGSRRVFVQASRRTRTRRGLRSRRGTHRCRWPSGTCRSSYLLIDFDSKFTKRFDAVFAADGAKVKRVGPLGPNLNAYAERWVQSLRKECLDHFVICGERHLRFVLKEYLAHYNHERPHQSKGNVPLPEADCEPSIVRFPSGEIECRERLGGLLRHYHRVAA